MSIASLQPSKLKIHYNKKHHERKDDDIDDLFAKKVQYDLEVMLPRLDLW